jgi:DegV family protein with EDD domain
MARAAGAPGNQLETTASRKVRIVVDSSVCLTPGEGDALGMTVVPLVITMHGEQYRDLLDLTQRDFYRVLRNGGRPSSSAPSPGSYLEAFRIEAEDVLCLTPPAGISAAYRCAMLAQEMAAADQPERVISVVDAHTAGPGLRLLALDAARLAAQGQDLAEIKLWVERQRARTSIIASLPTLEYLARSGRVPQVASWGGSVLRVITVVRYADGRGSLHQLVRGSERAHRVLVDAALPSINGSDAVPYRPVVFHADAESDAHRLAGDLRAARAGLMVDVSGFTPAMGIHTGPGVVGIAYYEGRTP